MILFPKWIIFRRSIRFKIIMIVICIAFMNVTEILAEVMIGDGMRRLAFEIFGFWHHAILWCTDCGVGSKRRYDRMIPCAEHRCKSYEREQRVSNMTLQRSNILTAD